MTEQLCATEGWMGLDGAGWLWDTEPSNPVPGNVPILDGDSGLGRSTHQVQIGVAGALNIHILLQ